MSTIRTRPLSALAFTGLLALALSMQEDDVPRVLTSRFHHLGDDSCPDWEDTTVEPEGLRLELAFDAASRDDESVLELETFHVHARWSVLLNGVELAQLPRVVERAVQRFPVPAGRLLDGRNTLLVDLLDRPSGNKDDICVGHARLHLRTLREVEDLHPVRISVRERGRPDEELPARLTLVDDAGQLAPIFLAARETTAIRDGIAYTKTGDLHLELRRGTYTVYASKGTEWSRARAPLQVGESELVELALELERQVDTAGYVAADTHLHTLTFSGHGDASVEERVISLAAEGVELAVSTDHNHQLDYRPYQVRLDLTPWFTPVVGNEVTTSNGHFNAFPLNPEGPLPNWRIPRWERLVENVREAGAQVVILNHPRWPAPDDCPLSKFAFVPETGERDGPRFTFDCMELVNSTTESPDPFLVLRDWFGFLNGGERVFAVGTSDSHTVGDPVGQGRTYVRSSTDDPARIDVAEACRSFREGRISVSQGIVTDVRADGEFGMGDVVPFEGERLELRVRVAAPHFVTPREVRIFANGIEVARRELEPADGPVDEWLAFTLARPLHDAFLVCAVLGDDVDEPFWHSLNGYTFAATNPVFLDVDGDGAWSSAHEVAARFVGDTQAAARALDDPALVQLHRHVADDERAAAAVRALAEARRTPFLETWLARFEAPAEDE